MLQRAVIWEIERGIAHCRWFDQIRGQALYRNENLPLRAFREKNFFSSFLKKINFAISFFLIIRIFVIFLLFLFCYAIFEKYTYYYLNEEFKYCIEQTFIEKWSLKKKTCYYKAPTLYVAVLLVLKETVSTIFGDLIISIVREVFSFLSPFFSIGMIIIIVKNLLL
jgi:hypothetical protein